jgi:hypothetical protein
VPHTPLLRPVIQALRAGSPARRAAC